MTRRTRRIVLGAAVLGALLAPPALAAPVGVPGDPWGSGAAATGSRDGGVVLDTDPSASRQAPLPRISLTGPAPAGTSSDLRLLSDDTRIVSRLTARSGDSRLAAFSARVTDVDTGVTWSKRSGTYRMPASTNKVVTAYTALTSIGATTRLRTPVYQDPASPSVVYLKGGGDPTLSFTRLRTLAADTATALQAKGIRTIALKVDDTMFPSPTSAPGWKSSYLPYDVAPVRPLVVGSRDVWDTSLDAARYFRAYLGDNGISVSSTARRKVPSGSPLLARTSSKQVASIVAGMLNVSQNDYAEILLRVAAKRRGYATGWTGATTNARDLLVAAGIPTTGFEMYDGSGLSRSDRMPVATMDGLLRTIVLSPDLAAVFLPGSSLPVSGVSGTLANRFRTWPTSCARSRIHAKTGTLGDVVALAGVSYGVDGRRRVFTLLSNQVSSIGATRAAIDLMATTTTGCY